jgi:hypothetical protein
MATFVEISMVLGSATRNREKATPWDLYFGSAGWALETDYGISKLNFS